MCWDHPPEDRHSAATAVRFGFKPPDFMSLTMFQSIVDDLHRLGTRRVDLVGRGEPLLNPAVVDIVAHAKKREMLVILCTNASRLSQTFSDRFVGLGLDRLNVSLNAGTPETYPHIHVTESPADYIRVKHNLKYLSGARHAAGKTAPHVRLSFVIGSKNYFEIDAMVRVVKEVGANEAMFVHTVVHEGTPDLALNPVQYKQLLDSVSRAKDTAAELGVTTNLATFAAIIPTYRQENGQAPTVVPCYAGWYFANILANGSVMPCCQCSKPIDRISDTNTFGQIWASQNYREFRVAAKGLPMMSERLSSCECDRCMLRPRNLSIHNLLHPLNRIDVNDEQLFTVKDLLRLKKVDRS
jgi:MoaA/NifB/PqqE/SkfB family radical SAM enzyme